MTTIHQVADALRTVAMKLEHAIEAGHHGTGIDANDLIETLTSVADELDSAAPTTVTPPKSLLAAAKALLEARENQMVTRVEWDQLAKAVATGE